MDQIVQVIAVIVIVAHCVAIFWPRKPLAQRSKPSGEPVVFYNECATSQDVACVWRQEPPGDTSQATSTKPVSCSAASR